MKSLFHLICAVFPAACLFPSCVEKISDVIIPAPVSVEYTGGFSKAGDRTMEVMITGEGPAESYFLKIQDGRISIDAADEAGAFYAGQSLAQLKTHYGSRLPNLIVTDYPRFKYRGVMLDAARHYLSIDDIRKQLPVWASLKLNVFHLHLTEHGGWRFESRRHPELTERGAWRKEPDFLKWEFNDWQLCLSGDDGAYGGYYTQDELRALVAYADSLHITIIPEIEMFGHSFAATWAIPEIGCNSRPTKDLCLGKEKTFQVLEDVLDELMDIFPSEYIHIGGDEAKKDSWKVCPDCQKRMRKEGLKSVEELQSYGIARIERYLNSKGRRIIGWDEILQGGLAPDATVMSWRGEKGGREAAAAGHDVIMTPSSCCYLDYFQDAPFESQPVIGSYLPIDNVYSYDPAPSSMDGADHVIGVQGNLWGEAVADVHRMEYQFYPRLCAIAEVAWTPLANKNYESFRERAAAFSDNLKSNGFKTFDLRDEIGHREIALRPVEHLAKGCKVTLENYTPLWFRANGAETLTDGILGDWDYKDGCWLGFCEQDMDFTIDLGDLKSVRSIETSYYKIASKTSCIVFPTRVVYSVSADGKEFTEVYSEAFPAMEEDPVIDFREVRWKSDNLPVQARYIRVFGAANERRFGNIIIDEVVVR